MNAAFDVSARAQRSSASLTTNEEEIAVTMIDLPPDIQALRDHLGAKRFLRFIAALPTAGLLHFWQDRELDRLEDAAGVVFPREAGALGVLLSPFLPESQTLSEDEVPEWIAIECIYGNAPVQAEGRALEPPARFYFRARHESWSIGVSPDPEVDPVDVGGTGDGFFFHEEDFGHSAFDASYMPQDVARFFIVRELTRWRVSRLQP